MSVGSSHRQAGFTLLELMIVVAILAIVAGIGVPQYLSALRAARNQKARQELVTIAGAIDAYRGSNGALPLTLHQIGHGGRRDPWGVLYCYLNYADGTGDGLDWAVTLGLVDPSAFKEQRGSASAAGGAAGGGGGGGAAMETPEDDFLTAITATITRDISYMERQTLETSVREASALTVFTGVATTTVRRRDRYMFPLNTDYDLFSLGPNRSSAVSLGAALAQDDVIRANDGGFYGPASEY